MKTDQMGNAGRRSGRGGGNIIGSGAAGRSLVGKVRPKDKSLSCLVELLGHQVPGRKYKATVAATGRLAKGGEIFHPCIGKSILMVLMDITFFIPAARNGWTISHLAEQS